MREQGGAERLVGDCINAVFQGFFDRTALLEEQTLEGLGIAIDDEFNFLLSHWRAGMLNGDSFLKTSTGHLLYGTFEQNLPVGLVAIHREGVRVFLSRVALKRGGVEWSKEAAAVDSRSNLFYVLELSRRDDQETTLDPKTSNSQTSRYDRVKLQWKVKIVERCPLKLDGSLATTSKLARRYDRKLDYSRADYTNREQNEVSLLCSTLGSAFSDPAFISQRLFLKKMAQANPRIALEAWRERNEDEEIMMVSLAGGKNNEKKLGMAFSLTYDYIKSLGSYQEGRLHGLGLQYRKSGESLVGTFKEGILVKQYKHNQNNVKNVATFTIRELAVQEHLKSLNYVHNTIYLPEVPSLTAMAAKVSGYIDAFEREFEKRNLNYNETPSLQSISSETMNIYKYVDFNRQRHEHNRTSRQQLLPDSAEVVKKPGFILNRSKNKSIDKTPTKNKTPSPPQKSPLRNVRIKGKIYHETQGYDRSPSRQTARLKLSEEAYRQDRYQ